MELFKLLGVIAVDNSNANKSIDETVSKANKSQGTFRKIFGNIGKSFSNAFKGIGSNVKRIFNINFVNEKLNGIVSKVSSLSSRITQPFRNIGTKFKNIFSSKKPQLDLSNIENRTQGMSGKISNSLLGIGKVLGTVFVASKIKDFFTSGLEAAANLDAMASQFTQVFGDMESQAQKSLSSISNEAGMAENRMKGSFIKIAAFAKSSGMDTKGSLDVASRAMKVASDSAAFYDRSLEETTESLQSFLKGNYANDAALGISATETTRNAAANRLYGKSFKDLSEEQKQLTLLQMVEDGNKLSGALGQAARETDTWTNQLGNLNQKWSDFKALVSKPLLGIAVKGIKLLAEGLESLGSWFESIGEKWNSFTSNISNNEYVQKFIEVFENVKTRFENIINRIVEIVVNFYNNSIKPLIDTIVETFFTAEEGTNSFLDGILSALTSMYDAVFAFYEFLLSIVDWIVSNILVPIVQFVIDHMEQIKGVIDGILKVIKGIFDVFAGLLTGDWKRVWNGISNIFKGVWEALKNYVVLALDWIKTKIQLVWNVVKGVTQAVWNGIKGFFSSVWNGIKSVVSGAINSIKSTVSSVFEGLKNTVTSIWNGIKTAISTPIEAAYNVVKSVIDKIKGVFNFKFKWPHIPLPHFSISGSANPLKWLTEGVPRLSVKWYAKGGIFDKPTIFNTPYGLKGVGEAGAEAVAPISKLTEYVAEAVRNENSNMGYKFDVLINLFSEMLEFLKNTNSNIYFNAEKVGEVLNPILARSITEGGF